MNEHIEGHVFPTVVVVLLAGDFLLELDMIADLGDTGWAATFAVLVVVTTALVIVLITFFVTWLTYLLVLVLPGVAAFEKGAPFDLALVFVLSRLLSLLKLSSRRLFVAWLATVDGDTAVSFCLGI